MAYVIKVKYEDTLRRLTLKQSELDEGRSFARMQNQIRELFEVPRFSKLVVTYLDRDDDVVTMGSDQDMEDALIQQGLNPLRVFVSLVDRKAANQAKVDNLKDVMKSFQGSGLIESLQSVYKASKKLNAHHTKKLES